MELTMSMFASQKDYWKARAELAEKTVEETAKELGCEPDNEAMLHRANDLRKLAVVIESDTTQPDWRRKYARDLLAPNAELTGGGAPTPEAERCD